MHYAVIGIMRLAVKANALQVEKVLLAVTGGRLAMVAGHRNAEFYIIDLGYP